MLFHDTDTYVASVGDDGLLKFCDAPDCRESLAAPRRCRHGVDAVAGRQPNLLRQRGQDRPRQCVRHRSNHKAIHRTRGTVTALAASGTLIAGGTADQRLFLWNAANGKLFSQGIAHQGFVTGAAFHPQGTQLVTACADGLLKLWALPPVPGGEFLFF